MTYLDWARYCEAICMYGLADRNDYSEMIHIITYTEAISGCEVEW